MNRVSVPCFDGLHRSASAPIVATPPPPAPFKHSSPRKPATRALNRPGVAKPIPIVPIVPVRARDSSPQSPIEDFSLMSATSGKNARVFKAQPSELLAEVKMRVAKHSATQSRGKLARLTEAKPTASLKKKGADDSSVIDLSASSPPRDVAGTSTSKSSVRRPDSNLSVLLRPLPTSLPKGKKVQKVLETVVDGAKRLIKEYEETPPKNQFPQFLSGCHIYYYGMDMNYISAATKGRMKIVSSLSLLATSTLFH